MLEGARVFDGQESTAIHESLARGPPSPMGRQVGAPRAVERSVRRLRRDAMKVAKGEKRAPLDDKIIGACMETARGAISKAK